MNATVLPLPIQVLVHAGCSRQCQGRGLARCRPQSVGRCPEAGGVIKQLLISQTWVQVPIIDILLSGDQWVADLSKDDHFPVTHKIVSHEWSSTSWCSFEVGFISKSWTDWLQASICWQMSACYAPARWLVLSVGDLVLLCRWLRPFSSMWNELVLSLCLNWMTHVSGKLLFVFDA